MTSVSASEFQENFGEWHDKIYEGPVEITRDGQPTAYLVSAQMFHQLWERFSVSVPVEELSENDVALIMSSKVETNSPYNLDDIPEIE